MQVTILGYGIKSAVVDKVVKAGEHMKIGDEEICVFDATGHSLGGVLLFFQKIRWYLSEI